MDLDVEEGNIAEEPAYTGPPSKGVAQWGVAEVVVFFEKCRFPTAGVVSGQIDVKTLLELCADADAMCDLLPARWMQQRRTRQRSQLPASCRPSRAPGRRAVRLGRRSGGPAAWEESRCAAPGAPPRRRCVQL